MKTTDLLLPLILVSLTACATPTGNKTKASVSDAPETVEVIYHVKAGQEAALQEALIRAWDIYRKEKMVFNNPHIVFQGTEGNNKPRIVEIFTWLSRAEPDHAPKSVRFIWSEMQALCETRDGHPGLEGGEIELITPNPSHR